jgi:hypothetical protein
LKAELPFYLGGEAVARLHASVRRLFRQFGLQLPTSGESQLPLFLSSPLRKGS